MYFVRNSGAFPSTHIRAGFAVGRKLFIINTEIYQAERKMMENMLRLQ